MYIVQYGEADIYIKGSIMLKISSPNEKLLVYFDTS